MSEEAAPRPVPGERTIDRVNARSARRMKAGLATAVFFRSAMEGAVEGAAGAEAEGDLVFLSGAPFYAMLRRLAGARNRRNRRLAALERRSERGLKAAKRRWPGEGRAVMARIASAADRLVFPQRQDLEPAAAEPQVTVRAPRVRRRGDAQQLLALIRSHRDGEAVLEEFVAERLEAEQAAIPADPPAKRAARATAKAIPAQATAIPAKARGARAATGAGREEIGQGIGQGIGQEISQEIGQEISQQGAQAGGGIGARGAAGRARQAPARAARPMDRAGQRLQRAAAESSPLSRALAEALPAGAVRHSGRLAEGVGALAAQAGERVVARALRARVAPVREGIVEELSAGLAQEAARRGAAPAASRARPEAARAADPAGIAGREAAGAESGRKIAREAQEIGAGIAPARLSRQAAARMHPEAAKAGGLRPLLRGTPSMSVVAPIQAEAPADEAEARPSAVPRPVERRGRADRRARAEAAQADRARVDQAAQARPAGARGEIRGGDPLRAERAGAAEIGAARGVIPAEIRPEIKPEIKPEIAGAAGAAEARPQRRAVAESRAEAAEARGAIPSRRATAIAAARGAAQAEVAAPAAHRPVRRGDRFEAAGAAAGVGAEGRGQAPAGVAAITARAEAGDGARGAEIREDRGRGAVRRARVSAPAGVVVRHEEAPAEPQVTEATPARARRAQAERRGGASAAHAAQRSGRAAVQSLAARALLLPVAGAEPVAARAQDRAQAPADPAGIAARAEGPAGPAGIAAARAEIGAARGTGLAARAEIGARPEARGVAARPEARRAEAPARRLSVADTGGTLRASEAQAEDRGDRQAAVAERGQEAARRRQAGAQAIRRELRQIERTISRAVPVAGGSAMPDVRPALERLQVAAEATAALPDGAAVEREIGRVERAIRAAGAEVPQARAGERGARPVRAAGVRRGARGWQPTQQADGRFVAARQAGGAAGVGAPEIDAVLALVEAELPRLLPLGEGPGLDDRQQRARAEVRGAVRAAVERLSAPAIRQNSGLRALSALEGALAPVQRRARVSVSPVFYAAHEGAAEGAGAGAEISARSDRPVAGPRGVWMSARAAARLARAARAAGAASGVGAAGAAVVAGAGGASGLARIGGAAARRLPVADTAGTLRAEAPGAQAAEVAGAGIVARAPGRGAAWALRRSVVADAPEARQVGGRAWRSIPAALLSAEAAPAQGAVGAQRAQGVLARSGEAREARVSPVAALARAREDQAAGVSAGAPGVVSPGVVSPGVVSPGVVSPGVVSPGAARPGARRARTADLGTTLTQVAAGTVGAAASGAAVSDAPGWAARSRTDRTGIKTVDGLVVALARASSVEEVVRVIVERAEGRSGSVPQVLGAPLGEVAQQIRTEARREVDTALLEARRAEAQEAPAAAPSAPVTRQSRVSAPAAQTLKPAAAPPSSSPGFRHGGRSVAASARSIDGAANSRVTRLIRKLQGLIHLAEEERRLADARRQVRMAEDTAAARAEGQGPLGRGGSGSQRPIDIEALGREVTEIVSNEIANRRNRRMEDSDEFWW